MLRRLCFFDSLDDEHGIAVSIVWEGSRYVKGLTGFKTTRILKITINQLQVLSVIHLQPLYIAGRSK